MDYQKYPVIVVDPQEKIIKTKYIKDFKKTSSSDQMRELIDCRLLEWIPLHNSQFQITGQSFQVTLVADEEGKLKNEDYLHFFQWKSRTHIFCGKAIVCLYDQKGNLLKNISAKILNDFVKRHIVWLDKDVGLAEDLTPKIFVEDGNVWKRI